MKHRPRKTYERMEVTFELIVFGIIVGVIEDVIAIAVTTGHPITPGVLITVVLIAVPFAVLGEAIFDRIDFASFFRRVLEEDDESNAA